jgi:hypothetical protein
MWLFSGQLADREVRGYFAMLLLAHSPEAIEQ